MSYIRNYVDVHVSTNNTGSKTMVLNQLFKHHKTAGYCLRGVAFFLILVGIVYQIVITIKAINDFKNQKELHQDHVIKKGAIYLGKTVLCIFLVLLGCYLEGFISISKAFTILVAVLTFNSGVFAYLYNNWNSNQTARMESAVKMRLQLHSEAGWRPKLYELMKKEEPVYRDVLYFTSFFNIKKESDKVELDIRIRYALERMVNAPQNVENVLDILYHKEKFKGLDDNSKSFVALLAKKGLNNQLNDNQEVIFKSCISLLLKADWKCQQDGIEKLAGSEKNKDQKKQVKKSE